MCHLPDGSSRSVGMTWSPNNCTRCRCTFSVYGPRVYCIKPSCDYCPGGYYVVGQCCPVCPTKQPPTVSGTSAPSKPNARNQVMCIKATPNVFFFRQFLALWLASFLCPRHWIWFAYCFVVTDIIVNDTCLCQDLLVVTCHQLPRQFQVT